MAFFMSQARKEYPSGETVCVLEFNIDEVVKQVSRITGAPKEKVASVLDYQKAFSLLQDGLIRAVQEEIKRENSTGV